MSSKNVLIGVGAFTSGLLLGTTIPTAQAQDGTPPISIPPHYIDFLRDLTVFRRDWSPFHRNLDPVNWWVKLFSYAQTEVFGEDLVIGVELEFTQERADNWLELIIDMNYDSRNIYDYRVHEPWWLWTIGSGGWTGDLMYKDKVIWSFNGLTPGGQDYVGQPQYDPFRKVVPFRI